MLPTPFNAIVAATSGGTVGVCLGRVSRGQLWVKKWSNLIFPKLLLDHLGCSNKWLEAVLSCF